MAHSSSNFTMKCQIAQRFKDILMQYDFNLEDYQRESLENICTYMADIIVDKEDYSAADNISIMAKNLYDIMYNEDISRQLLPYYHTDNFEDNGGNGGALNDIPF